MRMRRGISLLSAMLTMVAGGVLVLYSFFQGEDVYYLIAGIACMVFAGRAIEKMSDEEEA